MTNTTAIEWTDVTWNPVTGCDRTSPGCDNCYALRLARRLHAMGQPRYQNNGNPATSGPGFATTCHPDLLDRPRRWRTPRLVFVNSMSDLFHPDVGDDFIHAVFATMNDTPQHTYQILTKRSKRLAALSPQLTWTNNIWAGVSVETRQYRYRINHLAATGAAVRFISAEPLLGDLEELELDRIDWVITGGESGPNARSIEPGWVRNIRDQCTATDTAFFFKQWGGHTPKARGRDLDGRIWDDMPQLAQAATNPA